MPAKYDILRQLETDSASTLYLAQAKKRGEECSLRRFKASKPEEIEGLTELFTQLASIDSPHIVQPLDFGTDKEGFYTVTAGQPEGETLEQALHRGPLTADEFEIVALQLLDALEVLHEQAIVHGSIRPDYVRITGTSRQDWQVTLHGFGQGFAVREDNKEAQIRAYRCTAPEQWQDGTTRRRTDVYALGCVLYEALAARPPFDGRALKELRIKHIGHDLAPLHKLASHVPAWMCAWVMHLLAADPEQRPRKAAAARELFERREAPPQPEPTRLESAPPPPQAPSSPQMPLAQQVSAPVVLPASQLLPRHVTSSTIPISMTGSQQPARPGSGPPAPGRPRPPTVSAPRKTPAPPRGSSAATARKPLPPQRPLKPFIIGGAAILLLGAVFILPRCGAPPPAATKTAAPKKR